MKTSAKKVICFLSDVSIGFCLGVVLDCIFDTSLTFTIIGTIIGIAVVTAIYVMKGRKNNEQK